MSFLVKYLLGFVCASIIVSIAIAISSKNPVIGAVIKLLSGIYLAITLLSPFLNVRIEDFTDWFDYIQLDSGAFITSGEEVSAKAMDEIIIEQTTAYILDKAAALKISPEVDVILSDDNRHVPYAVVLSGDASPYAKQKLQQIIAEELCIAKEHQTWN